jgi:hypothetical protein
MQHRKSVQANCHHPTTRSNMAAAGNWERKVKDGAPSYSEQFRILKGCKDYDILATPYAKPSPEAQVTVQQQQQQSAPFGVQQAAAAAAAAAALQQPEPRTRATAVLDIFLYNDRLQAGQLQLGNSAGVASVHDLPIRALLSTTPHACTTASLMLPGPESCPDSPVCATYEFVFLQAKVPGARAIPFSDVYAKAEDRPLLNLETKTFKKDTANILNAAYCFMRFAIIALMHVLTVFVAPRLGDGLTSIHLCVTVLVCPPRLTL